MLLDTAGRVVTREDISQRVLGRGFDPFDRSIDVHVGKVRRKLGDSPNGDERIKSSSRSRDTSMRSLAIKIFLSFWLAQVVILVGLEIMSGLARRALPKPRAVPHIHSSAGGRRRRHCLGRGVLPPRAPSRLASQTGPRREQPAGFGRSRRAGRGPDASAPRRNRRRRARLRRDGRTVVACWSRLRSSCYRTSPTSCDRRSRGCRWRSSSRGGKPGPMPRRI